MNREEYQAGALTAQGKDVVVLGEKRVGTGMAVLFGIIIPLFYGILVFFIIMSAAHGGGGGSGNFVGLGALIDFVLYLLPGTVVFGGILQFFKWKSKITLLCAALVVPTLVLCRIIYIIYLSGARF